MGYYRVMNCNTWCSVLWGFVLPSFINHKFIKMKKRNLQIFGLIGLFSCAMVLMSTTTQPLVKDSHVKAKYDCQVTNSEIISYLEGFGYSNVSVLSGEYMNCDRICSSDYSYNTKVFCTETQIIGHEDIPTK